MLGNVIQCPACRLVHAYWQKTEYVLKCSFFSQDEGTHENERGSIHCAKRSLWLWGLNLFWILNMTSVLLVSPTKGCGMTSPCCPKNHSCALILMKCIESFIQYQYVKPRSPWNNNGIFLKSDLMFWKECQDFQRKNI